MFTFLLVLLIIDSFVLIAAILLQSGKGSGLAASFGGVSSSADSLLGLLNDVLDLSRIEAGKLSIDPIPLNPRTLLKEAVQAFSVTANSKGIFLRSNCAAEVPEWILGDPIRLRQVLVNMIGNSVKFTEKGGVEIRASTADGGRRLNFAVSDTGIGIPLEKQQFLFRPFTQADGSITRKYGGSGLGLAISSKLIELMAGTIRLQSEPGKGTLIEFSVPFVGPHDGPAVQRSTNNEASIASAMRILLAEDNAVNQKVASRMFEKDGHSVCVVCNGKEALDALGRETFDAVFMDIQMPEMDGFEATAQIRAGERNSGNHVPIIAMTAHAMGGYRERCLAAGMDGYVSKPLHREDLRRALCAAQLKAKDPPANVPPSSLGDLGQQRPENWRRQGGSQSQYQPATGAVRSGLPIKEEAPHNRLESGRSI